LEPTSPFTAIVAGWESRREQQTKDEFEAAEDIDTAGSEV